MTWPSSPRAVSPPEGFVARAPVRADAQELAALLAASETAIRGSSEVTLNDFLGDWEGIDLAHDAIGVFDSTGTVAAYADTHSRGEELYYVYGYVHPNAWGRGLERCLIEWGEARARQQASQAESPEIRVRHYINRRDQRASELFTACGYLPVRTTLTMTIALDGEIESAHFPAGIELRPFDTETQLNAVYEAYEEAAADMWQRPPGEIGEFEAKLRRPYFDASLWQIAWEGDAIAGTLLAGDIDGNGWVESVGVRRPWRGRGLATAMLLHAFAQLKARGVARCGLSVDAESPTGAARVYERSGMQIDETFLVFERAFTASPSAPHDPIPS